MSYRFKKIAAAIIGPALIAASVMTMLGCGACEEHNRKVEQRQSYALVRAFAPGKYGQMEQMDYWGSAGKPYKNTQGDWEFWDFNTQRKVTVPGNWQLIIEG